MITISSLIGSGLFWGNQVVPVLNSPVSLVLSFLFVGLVAWAVMQSIAEMTLLRPVSGTLSKHVSEFIDNELGIIVGITYL